MKGRTVEKITGRAVIILYLLFAITCLSCVTGVNAPRGARGPFRGLYVPNRQACSLDYARSVVKAGKPLGVNMLVMDVQPIMSLRTRIDRGVIEYLKREGMYVAARVVCFQDGLKSLPVPEEQMEHLFATIEGAAGAGFDEVQLDYIRFPDGAPYYALSAKYGFVDGLLKRARAIADARGVVLSADLFGRVVFNHDDIIGQKIENFAKHADVIYPMLYPSHFTGDTGRLANPGETVRDGTLRGMERVKGTRARIQPFIQAFGYNIGWARVGLDRYVELQIAGAESTGARGWVAWNAKGDYDCVFRALERLR